MKALTLRTLSYLGLVVAMSSCSKSSVTPSPSAREYTVEYRVNATGTSTASVVAYADQTGNLTQITSASLPASYKFQRTLKSGDGLNIVAAVAAPLISTTITATILLDGKSVKTQSGSSAGGGTTSPSATANVAYVLP